MNAPETLEQPTKIKERPILFSGEMVRAILDGRKTQTRRVIGLPSLQRSETPGYDWTWRGQAPIKSVRQQQRNPGGCWQDVSDELLLSLCPYGQPDDRLWVREAFQKGHPVIDDELQDFDEDGNKLPEHIWYAATPSSDGGWISDRGHKVERWSDEDGYALDGMKWRPSIHMPRWASRITLKITNVTVQRIQDISDEGALAEGLKKWPHKGDFAYGYGGGAPHSHGSPTGAFYALWDSINADRGYSWSSNPWVWVVEFKKVND